MKVIIIKSFNGIGDLLFLTPTLRVIKKAYPDSKIVVNTNRPSLLKNNPFVDVIGSKNEGIFLGYTAPDTGRLPNQHHILEDWKIVCKAYDLKTERPLLVPELYTGQISIKKDIIGVQVLHKRNYHSKRVWPHFEALANQKGFEAIPEITTGDKMLGIVKAVSEYKNVVCAEGGISHIRAALGLPAVVLFGGFSDPNWTGYDFHKNITSDVDCKHCYNLSPCKKSFICWDEFSLDSIKKLAQKI